MALPSAPPVPETAAPPSSPVLGPADSGINSQTAAAATSVPLSEASLSAYNEAIGVLDPIAPYQTAARPERDLAPTREMSQFPGERPLSAHFMISSCSDKAYVPTPFNTPRTASRRESHPHLAQASSPRREEKPTLRGAAPRLRGGGGVGENEKVYLRGGGPKKRRGAAAGNGRKKPKPDKYADVDHLLSDFKSPIFQEDANIKAVLTHPLTRQTMTEQSEPYPFDEMTGDEIATTVADFKSDGSYGRFDPDWIDQAIKASQIRASGGYDAYLDSQFAEDWAEDEEGVSDEEMKDLNSNGGGGGGGETKPEKEDEKN
ncbi:hypothetical protein BCIN_16g02240 [Botrytis cinerea B05.10]|uniref:ASX DEUBAD domain-containing protein n=2 Tax=Botryotinia fuckeliana TaxID=40559 RepID=A0A384K7C8_BOTFB|nr:hypothetical protein BCIN_16g02240 [Botrytis cinerea B05.10]ATZ58447.1 hypothetical protein BCIN_16g02240 [Botrytis cinerea B05.10]EMR84763.1 putative proline-rich early nodulin protein [Botrytis cinerea BcDW1]